MGLLTKNKGNLAAVILLILGISVSMYMRFITIDRFQNNSAAALSDMRIRIVEVEPSHINLLFQRYGGAVFNYYGEQISLYMDFYSWDELVLSEVVVRLTTSEETDLNGSLFRGLKTERNIPGELRAELRAGGAMHQNYFDFSRLDFFHPQVTIGPADVSGHIERGARHVLQVWQTGNMVRVSRDDFNPEVLRGSENTAILYLIFD